jgi:HK97 family phage portal protein/2'-5' RNA ligase
MGDYDKLLGFANDTTLARAYNLSIWAYRCIEVFASSLAGVDRVAHKADGELYELDHWLSQLVGIAANNTFARWAADRRVFGTAYGMLEQQPHGGYQLVRINPQLITPLPAERGQGIAAFSWRVNGVEVARLTPQDLLYMPMFNPEDDFSNRARFGGIASPLARALSAVEADEVQWAYVLSFFVNDAMPAFVLETEQPVMAREQIAELQLGFERDFKGIENKHKPFVAHSGLGIKELGSPMKDLIIPELQEVTVRRIAAAIGVPLTLAMGTDAANFATMKEQHTTFYTVSVLPELNAILSDLNSQLLPRLRVERGARVEADRGSIEVLQEDRVEITSRTTAEWQAGLLTLAEARARLGLQPLDRDYMMVAGQWVEVSAIEAGQLPEPPMPGGGGFAGLLSDIPDDDSARLDIKEDARGASVLLRIANRADLISLQRKLKGQAGGAGRWVEPNDLHITLAIAPDVSDSQLEQLRACIETLDYEPLALALGSLRTFDTLGEYALHFRIRTNPALTDLQAQVYNLFERCGIETVSHSQPAQYIPHITLGYLPDKQRTLRYDNRLTIETGPLVLSVEEGDGYRDVISIKAAYHAARRDLVNWHKKVRNRGVKAAFKSDAIPPGIFAHIRMELATLAPGDDAKPIFAHWLDALKAQPDDLPEDIPTYQEFSRYWAGVDDSFDDIAKAFASYLDEQRERILAQLRAGKKPDKFFGDASELIAMLAGTVEEPGPLANVLLAGYARGNDILEGRIAPTRRIKAEDDDNPAWDVVMPEAVDWALEYAASLVSGVNDRTQRAIQDTLAGWVEVGGSFSDLALALEDNLLQLDMPPGWSGARARWATSPQRAALIAQTESTNIFAEGSRQRWKAADVKQVKWRTARDELVCPLCRALHNQTGDIDKGIYYNGPHKVGNRTYYTPAAHPNCRCFLAPVAN